MVDELEQLDQVRVRSSRRFEAYHSTVTFEAANRADKVDTVEMTQKAPVEVNELHPWYLSLSAVVVVAAVVTAEQFVQ